MAQKITTTDVKEAIQHRYGHAQGYALFYEVEDPQSGRRCDALGCGLWSSNGHQMVGFEVKTNRTDFLEEMKHPAKAQGIMRYCHRWYLVSTPGVAKPSELPPTWGQFVYTGRIFKRAKDAPLLNPEPMTPALLSNILRRAGLVDERIIAEAVRKAVKEQQDREDARVKSAVKNALFTEQHEAKVQSDRYDAFDKAFADMPAWQIEEMAPLVKAIRRSGVFSSFRGAKELAAQLTSMGNRLNDALEALASAQARETSNGKTSAPRTAKVPDRRRPNRPARQALQPDSD